MSLYSENNILSICHIQFIRIRIRHIHFVTDNFVRNLISTNIFSSQFDATKRRNDLRNEHCIYLRIIQFSEAAISTEDLVLADKRCRCDDIIGYEGG